MRNRHRSITDGLPQPDVIYVESRHADKLVYFISDDCGHIKIGIANAPVDRLRDMQIANATELKIEATTTGGNGLEQLLHRRFAASHIRGEWFHLTTDVAEYIDDLRAVDLPTFVG